MTRVNEANAVYALHHRMTDFELELAGFSRCAKHGEVYKHEAGERCGMCTRIAQDTARPGHENCPTCLRDPAAASFKWIGRMTSSTLAHAVTMTVASDAGKAKPGDVLRLSYLHDGPLRPGQLTVVNADPITGCIHVNGCIRDAIPAACHDDYVFVESSVDDHAALVAYLLSAVRRKDWHAVSDAANDLRVLEARR